MTIDQSISISAPADKVWAILGDQFHDAHKWASSVNHSEPREAGPAVGDAPFQANGRACETSLGPVRETIRAYDSKARRFSYGAKADKMPFFVKDLQNSWWVTPEGPDESRVTMVLEVRLLPVFAQVMGPVLRRQFTKVTGEATEELKHYVETGRPHPRKVEAARKAQTSSVAPALA
ncbi:MAG: SRPBCC family protein [Bacteroidota bacterium]